MGKALFVLFFSFVGLTSFAQTGVKVYGYVRDVLPGNIPNRQVRSAKPNTTTYMIYISAPSKYTITPVEVWINGEKFSAKSLPNVKTPVLVPKDNTGNQISLVAKTSNKLQQIVTAAPAEATLSASAKTKARTNELVIVYKLNGKLYTASLKKFTRLETLSAE
jgi:hypothetical protein